MEKYFSIVIPVYNVAGYVEKCLDSILAQTFEDYEVILVDDGSTDETPAIIDQYAKKDDRITVIQKKNEGVSIARNTGMEKATGKYFLFFDGDDFVEPYCLQELHEIAEKNNIDTIIYGYHRYANGEVWETNVPQFPNQMYEGKAVLEEILPKFIGISYDGINAWLRHEEGALVVENPALWRSMVSVDVVKKNGLLFNPELRVGEDTLFISEYLTFAQHVYIQKKCYYYLVTRETSTIYVYEKKPLQKLEGKQRLLKARLEFTERVKTRLGIDITSWWAGTILMSVVEMAFLLSAKHPEHSGKERYRFFLQYAKNPSVRRIVKNFKLQLKPSIMVIPFLLLKWGWNGILYICTILLHLVHYEFKRS